MAKKKVTKKADAAEKVTKKKVTKKKVAKKKVAKKKAVTKKAVTKKKVTKKKAATKKAVTKKAATPKAATTKAATKKVTKKKVSKKKTAAKAADESGASTEAGASASDSNLFDASPDVSTDAVQSGDSASTPAKKSRLTRRGKSRPAVASPINPHSLGYGNAAASSSDSSDSSSDAGRDDDRDVSNHRDSDGQVEGNQTERNQTERNQTDRNPNDRSQGQGKQRNNRDQRGGGRDRNRNRNRDGGRNSGNRSVSANRNNDDGGNGGGRDGGGRDGGSRDGGRGSRRNRRGGRGGSQDQGGNRSRGSGNTSVSAQKSRNNSGSGYQSNGNDYNDSHSGGNAAIQPYSNESRSERDDEEEESNEPETLQLATGILERPRKGEARVRQLEGTYRPDAMDPVIPNHIADRYALRMGDEITVVLGEEVGNMGGGGGRKKQRGPVLVEKTKLNEIDPRALRAIRVHSVDDIEFPEPPRKRRRRGRKAKQLAESNPNVKKAEEKRRQQELELESAISKSAARPSYEDLTTIDPEPRLTLEYPGCPPACRLIDMFCPIGRGQRAMIVSPPKAGKTTIMHNIANAIHHNHPDVLVFALLVDERPEEVTDFKRSCPCTVFASSNDHPPERHVALTMLAVERFKRLAEAGKDVVVLMDSLTRVGRAFNTAPGVASMGRTLSGGLDATALAIPKQLFGAARKFEEGGSLTMIATALIETGSRGDDVIFEEFKGTGNMELILDREIANRRLFPAINLAASGTRKDEKLLSSAEYNTVNALRRRLLNMPPVQQVEQLLKALERYPTNAELVGMDQR